MPMYLEGIKYVLAFLSGYITIYITFLNKLVNLGQLRAFRIKNMLFKVLNILSEILNILFKITNILFEILNLLLQMLYILLEILNITIALKACMCKSMNVEQ